MSFGRVAGIHVAGHVVPDAGGDWLLRPCGEAGKGLIQSRHLLSTGNFCSLGGWLVDSRT